MLDYQFEEIHGRNSWWWQLEMKVQTPLFPMPVSVARCNASVKWSGAGIEIAPWQCVTKVLNISEFWGWSLGFAPITPSHGKSSKQLNRHIEYMLFISYLHLIEGIGCRCGVIQEMVFFLNNAARDSRVLHNQTERWFSILILTNPTELERFYSSH